MNVENMAFGLDVRQRKLDLSIDPSRPYERGIEALDPIGGHDDLDVPPFVEPVELVEQLEHGPLNLAGAPRLAVVALGSNRVDLVDEDDGGGHVVGHPKELAHELGPVSQIFLDEFGADHPEKGGGGVVGHRLGQEGLAGARLAVEDDPLGRFDADVLVELRMGQGKLDGLFDLLDLRLKTADVRVGLEGGLVDFHHRDHGVRVVAQDSHHAHGLVVQQDAAAGLQKVLVHAAQHVDVIFGTHRAAHDGVVVVDHLFQSSHRHGRPPQLLQFLPLLLIPILVRLEHLVVLDELLLQQQKILDALQFQQTQLTFRGGIHRGRLRQAGGAAAATAAAAGAGEGRRRLELFLFFLFRRIVFLRRVGRVGTVLAGGTHAVGHSLSHAEK
mmetsp:Transcript_28895/g.66128  ORF Transcript_28895/g.66128 Transcript_28895/m.66128 type:complete len:385 (+) Transcript_28895:271-1425(+)